MSSTNNLNLLIAGFPGLGLPATLALAVQRDTPACQVWTLLREHIPTSSRLILSTVSNKDVEPKSQRDIGSYASASDADFLTLRLSAPVCGGKGGFGSQLRAAGGRMSSKRKREQEDDNGSSRNLDGRRLRTVKEAKSLAEYLSTKPQMEQKRQEERSKRLEEIVETTKRKMNEIRHGGARLDSKFAEDREEIMERIRRATKASREARMSSIVAQASNPADAEGAKANNSDEASQNGEDASSRASTPPKEKEPAHKEPKVRPVKIFGWDEDEEFMSSDNSDDEQQGKTKDV